MVGSAGDRERRLRGVRVVRVPILAQLPAPARTVSVAQLVASPQIGVLHHRWQAIATSRDARAVAVFYLAHPPSRGCPALREVRVWESNARVCVQLVLTPGDPGYACPLGAIPSVVTVELETALAGRELCQPDGGS